MQVVTSQRLGTHITIAAQTQQPREQVENVAALICAGYLSF